MKNGERGQTLLLALLVVAVGTLVITPFVGHAGSSLIGSRIYGQAINEQYSSDSGVEHAIWNLTNGSLADQLTFPGDSASYSLSEAVNGVVPTISVSRDWETIVSDNFESGGWAGGTGWLYDWQPSGDASIVTTGTPYQGSYHLMLRRDTGYVKRAVNLFGLPGANLQFWAKANSIDAGETTQCLISENGADWTPVHTWINGDDDNVYHFYDIDLSSYHLTSEFWIAFQANMSGAQDYFYVDDLKVVWKFDTVAPLASDNLESGGWAGGSGWLYDWQPSGDASVVTTGTPYQGSYHLRLRRDTGYVNRAVDLSSQTEARLQFWAKADSFEAGETAQCLVSENGTAWTAVHTWVDGDDDDVYRFYDIDLSSYNLTSEFWIAFQANMSGTGDYLYVDDLYIKRPVVYGITAIAGGRTIRAVVRIVGGTVSVLSWWVV